MRRIVRLYDLIVDALAGLACVVLGGVVLLVAADVILRSLRLARGIPGIVEITEYGLLVTTVAGATWAMRKGAHVAVEIVVDLLPPRRRAVVAWFAALLGFGICAVLAWAGLRAMLRSMELNSLVIKTFVFPEWWLLSGLPVAMALLSVEFLLRLTGLRALYGRPDG